MVKVLYQYVFEDNTHFCAPLQCMVQVALHIQKGIKMELIKAYIYDN